MKTMLASSLLILSAATVAAQSKAAKTPGNTIAPGRYSCVFSFDGTFFDTKPVIIKDGNRYETARGEGTWEFQPMTRLVKFSGVLGKLYTNVSYAPKGQITGGLKNKKVPALYFKPSAAFKKEKGPEAVPQFCYLETPAK
jgi:hypothetical protein